MAAEFNKKIGVLHQLERARNAIRQKHRLLKVGRMEADRAASKTFKPIVQPLEKLIDVAMIAPSAKQQPANDKVLIKQELKKDNDIVRHEKDEDSDVESAGTMKDEDSLSQSVLSNQSFLSADESLHQGDEEEEPLLFVNSYVHMLETLNTNSLDKQVEVRISHSKLMIGNQPIVFEHNKIKVGGMEFDETPGLVELLFKKSPNMIHITPADEANFVKIVISTHAHRSYFKSDGEIRHNNEKFNKFIKRAVENRRRHSASKEQKGGSISYKIAKKRARKMDYVYWDNPNELIQRLELLLAESAAGNATGHVNEISSIIEELREAGIIY